MRTALDTVSSEVLDQFLSWLHPMKALANKEYTSIHLKLALFFEQHNCDPADCAFETIARVARMVKDGTCRDGSGSTIQNKLGFIFGVAKNVQYEYLRGRKGNFTRDPSFTHPQSETSVTRPATDKEEEDEEQLVSETTRKLTAQILNQCHHKECTLVLDYRLVRQSTKQYEALATKYGTSVDNLRVRVSRSKALLKIEYDTYLKKLRQGIQA
jgi:DNA-directed RNA polymerase specialized sigma24 family protein